MRFSICTAAFFGLLLHGSLLPGAERVTSLAVVSTDTARTVYLARNGRLFSADVTQGEVFALDSPTQVPVEIGYALSIAAKGPNILIADASRSLVIRYDPGSKASLPMIELRPGTSPTWLAASDSGQIAVYDNNREEISVYGPDAKTAARQLRATAVSGLAYAGDSLILLRRGDLYRVDNQRVRLAQPGIPLDSEFDPKLLSKLTDNLKARAITVDRGRVYISTDAELSLLTEPDFKPLRVLELLPTSFPQLISATDNKLAVYDPDRSRLTAIDQPRIAVAFSVEVPRQRLLAGTLAVYAYLQSLDALPVETYIASRDFPTLLDWLMEGEMIPKVASRSDAGDSDYAALAELICKMNASICGPDTSSSKVVLGIPVAAGTRLQFPRVPFHDEVVVRKRELPGTIGAYLESEFPDPQSFTNHYLSRLNAQKLETLDVALTDAGMLMTSPTSARLSPGDIVESNGLREEAIGKLSACGLQTTERNAASIVIPTLVATSAGLEALPSESLTLNKRRADILRVEVEYRRPYTRELDVKDDAEHVATCLSRLTARGQVALVDRVLKAQGARFRLIDKTGAVLALSKTELTELGAASPESKEWSFAIDAEFAVAYRPVLATETDPVEIRSLNDVTRFKPRSALNMRNKGPGEYLVPAFVWRLWALVSGDALRPNNSSLDAMRDQNIFVFPQFPLNVRSQADPDISDVKVNRDALLKSSHHMDLLPNGYGSVVLGVVEDGATVRTDHEVFVDSASGKSVWGRFTEEHVFEQFKVNASQTAPKIRSGILDRRDHGTHVGGIIASLNGDAPGFIRSAGLLLIDKTSQTDVAKLQQAIDAAISNVKVINFSQEIPTSSDDRVVGDLKEKLMKTWRDKALFVASAGNGDGQPRGLDLAKTGGDLALIKWSRDSPDNIVGVAATDLEGKIIDECRNDPSTDATTGCSNYGKQFVQLTAPGYRILSSGYDLDYVVASGTSMAAPQVSATAAMILKLMPSLSPRQLKMRLIYTADFKSAYVRDNSVWGGKLNVERAVFGLLNPTSYVVETNAATPEKFLVQFKPESKLELNNTGEIFFRDRDVRGRTPRILPFQNVLRMQFDDRAFWVVYYEPDSPNSLMIAYGVLPNKDNNIQISSLERWDAASKSFIKADKDHAWLTRGIPYDSIGNVVAPVAPNDVQF